MDVPKTDQTQRMLFWFGSRNGAHGVQYRGYSRRSFNTVIAFAAIFGVHLIRWFVRFRDEMYEKVHISAGAELARNLGVMAHPDYWSFYRPHWLTLSHTFRKSKLKSWNDSPRPVTHKFNCRMTN